MYIKATGTGGLGQWSSNRETYPHCVLCFHTVGPYLLSRLFQDVAPAAASTWKFGSRAHWAGGSGCPAWLSGKIGLKDKTQQRWISQRPQQMDFSRCCIWPTSWGLAPACLGVSEQGVEMYFQVQKVLGGRYKILSYKAMVCNPNAFFQYCVYKTISTECMVVPISMFHV